MNTFSIFRRLFIFLPLLELSLSFSLQGPLAAHKLLRDVNSNQFHKSPLSLILTKESHRASHLNLSNHDIVPPRKPPDSSGKYEGGNDDDWFEHRIFAASVISLKIKNQYDCKLSEKLRGGYAPQRRRRWLSRASNLHESSVTSALLLLTCLMFGAQWQYPRLTMNGAKITSKISNGQFYRLITPIFLHANFSHLLMNSMSLYNIGPFVEKWFGPKRMLSFYLLSGVGGVVASCVFSPRSPSVGASGAIFGMVGAAACFFASNKQELGEGAERGLQSIFRTVAINIFMGLQIRQIDNAGHAGGFFTGFLLTYLFGPNLRWSGGVFSGRMQLVDVPRISLNGIRKDWKNFKRVIKGSS